MQRYIFRRLVTAVPTIFGITILIFVAMRILPATHHNALSDYVVRLFMTLFLAVPSFWIGLTTVLFLVLAFTWRPPLVITDLWQDPLKNLQMVVGPAAALGLGLAAGLARMTRSTILEALFDDYVRTARSKGLRENAVVGRHVMRNALLPVVTTSGAAMGALIGGAVATETAFGVPGLGSYLVQALNARDWIVIQNLVLIYGTIAVLINML